MPKRYTVDMRIWIYRFLVARDGEFCRLCGKPPKKAFSLEIDHIDNDRTNDDPNNLQLAHSACNKNKELEFKGKKDKLQILNVSVEGSPATRIVQSNVDYAMGSAEMKANSFFELKFRQWLIGKIGAEGSVIRKDAKNSGAELVGCSPATIDRYIDKMCSEHGPLTEVRDYINNNLLVFKNDISEVLISLAKKQAKVKKAKKAKKAKKTKTDQKTNSKEEIKENGN